MNNNEDQNKFKPSCSVTPYIEDQQESKKKTSTKISNLLLNYECINPEEKTQSVGITQLQAQTEERRHTNPHHAQSQNFIQH